MDDFAKVLSAADKVILMEIYPARELPIKGVTSMVLLDKISCKQKELYDSSILSKVIEKTDLLMTLGAGDISDLVQPIKQYYF